MPGFIPGMEVDPSSSRTPGVVVDCQQIWARSTDLGGVLPAPTVLAMTTLGDGLVALLNGALSLGHVVFTPVSAGALVLAGGLAWLARLEIDAINRQGTKPAVGRH